jgi:soluble lytic murein transglycosylase
MLSRKFLYILTIIALTACNLSAQNKRAMETTITQQQSAEIDPTSTLLLSPIPTSTPLPLLTIESGENALAIGDWEEALNEFQSVFDASNQDSLKSAALLGIGRSYYFAQNFHEAVTIFEELIQNYPNALEVPYANFYLGQSYNALEQYKNASDAYLRYLILRPGFIDAYVLNLRGDSLFAAGNYAEAANDYQAAIKYPSLLDIILLQMKTARSYALFGDYPSAIAIYDDVYQLSNNDDTRALANYRKGQAYIELGQTDKAMESYLNAVLNFPTSYYAYLSLIELVDAEYPVDDLSRGIVDYYAGQYGVALAAFDRYLQNEQGDRGTALYYYGLSTRALGGYEEAIQQWNELITKFPDHQFWANAWDQKAYTQWAFLDQYTVATQTLLDFVESQPAHPRAPEFLFDAARIAERGGKLNQAAKLWERLANLYPTAPKVEQALFLAGISHFRLKEFTTAQNTFQRLYGITSNLENRSAAMFWMGKSQAAQGKHDEAKSTWEQTAGIDPTGYYSERARDILHNREPFTPPEVYDLSKDNYVEKTQAEAWLKSTFDLPENINLESLDTLAQNPNLIRGTELWQLGLKDEASSEFTQLRQSLSNDAANSYRLLNYLLVLGIYRPAIFTARQILDLALMDDAQTLNAPIYFNHIRFGTYYFDVVNSNAVDFNFNPLFLLSVIRQESLFESFIHSSSGAIGLMQLMPPTADDIAKNTGFPQNYQTNDLYRPIININYGAYYLNRQRQLFDENLYAILAAYNGGPGNAREWLKLAPDDQDLFLEVIRYPETRNYVQSIVEVFNIYRWIYNRTP